MADTGMFVLPLTNDPYFTFTSALEGKDYRFTIHYNNHTDSWYMNLQGLSNDVLINNIKLVPGVELIRQHGFKELGTFILVDQEGKDEDPDYSGFADRWILVYLDRTRLAS